VSEFTEASVASRVRLWAAVRRQASAWAETDAVRTFASTLPRNTWPGNNELSDALREIKAAAGSMFSNPFRLPGRLSMAASLMPGIDLGRLQSTHSEWFESGARVETAHRATMAWLRSRLPGYPMLPAPHLAPNTPFTTHEYTDRIIWMRRELSSGLHLNDPAPGITAVLGVDGAQASAINQVARDVANALTASPEWERLELARIGLDSTGRRDLSQARATLRDRLSPENVASYEPALALRRHQYRAAALDEAVSALSGSALEYASAFGAAIQILDHAASDIMSQLATYPLSEYSPSDLEVIEVGSEMVIRFLDGSPLSWLASPGEVGWINDELIADAVEITGVQINFSATGAGSVGLTARTLPGTSDAWR
jgi:hypothetical protein